MTKTTCPTKKKQYSRMGALWALLRIQREKPEGHNEQRTYACPKCRRWHLTSKPKAVRA